MSECRALTTSRQRGLHHRRVGWEGELDRVKLARGLARRVDPSNVETAVRQVPGTCSVVVLVRAT